MELARVPGPGDTHVWPASLTSARARHLDPDKTLEWADVTRRSITPFLVLETSAGAGSGVVVRRAVITTELCGDVGNRRARAMADILRSPADVLRYLSVLLFDPSFDLFATSAARPSPEAARGHNGGRSAGAADVILLEPLLRAVIRDRTALGTVQAFLDELRELPDAASLTPDGLHDIWSAVWQALGGHR